MSMSRSLFALAIGVIYLGILGIWGAMSDSTAQSECDSAGFSWSWPETDFCQISIDLDEVLSGGPPRDGIPAITDPQMEGVETAQTWLVPRSPVIAVEINGEAHAYPHAILMWHEIANDEVGGVPVAVTFCPLCNASIVFDRRLGDSVLEFGVSGLLRNSDMIMYDRTTFSWFQQFTGIGIAGFYNEVSLEFIPSQVVSFEQFAERYPDGLVMSQDTGFGRRYGSNPYSGLDDSRSPVTGLYRGAYDERLPARERVLAGIIDGVGIAYPFPVLSQEFIINDQIGETPVVAMWQPGVLSSLDEASIAESRDIGTAALFHREVDGRLLTFQYDEENGQMIDVETGSLWNLFGEATDGELAGQSLDQLIAAPHYWFAWYAFMPETRIYEE